MIEAFLIPIGEWIEAFLIPTGEWIEAFLIPTGGWTDDFFRNLGDGAQVGQQATQGAESRDLEVGGWGGLFAATIIAAVVITIFERMR
jgi:hypothetical protein